MIKTDESGSDYARQAGEYTVTKNGREVARFQTRKEARICMLAARKAEGQR